MENGRLEDVRVLIVDDDRDILESFDAAFQSEGAVTVSCMDGNDAVRICHEDEPPDLVILDMMLPKRSGFLVLERIKGREDSPAVIMVTANEGRRHQAYAESLGVDRYMLKPVPLQRLLDTAVELVDKRDKLLGIERVEEPVEEPGPQGADSPESGSQEPGSPG